MLLRRGGERQALTMGAQLFTNLSTDELYARSRVVASDAFKEYGSK
jgi:hypothetical protein